MCIETLVESGCASFGKQCHPRTTPQWCHYRWVCATVASHPGAQCSFVICDGSVLTSLRTAVFLHAASRSVCFREDGWSLDEWKDANVGKPCAVTEGQLLSLTIVSANVWTLRPRDDWDGGPSTRRLDLAGELAHKSRSQAGRFRKVEQHMVVVSPALATGAGGVGHWVHQRLGCRESSICSFSNPICF